MQTSKDLKVKKAVMRIHQVYELLIQFLSSKQAKHSVPDKGYLAGKETELSKRWAASKKGWSPKERRSTCQCQQLLQLSVSTEGKRGSAEPLLPLHSRVGAWLLHPHQLSCRRRRLTGALQRKGRVMVGRVPKQTAAQSLCSSVSVEQRRVWRRRVKFPSESDRVILGEATR